MCLKGFKSSFSPLLYESWNLLGHCTHTTQRSSVEKHMPTLSWILSDEKIIMTVKGAAIFQKFKGKLLYYLASAFIKINVDICKPKQGRGVCFVIFFWVLLFPVWVIQKELFCPGSFCTVVKGGCSQATDVYCVRDFFPFLFWDDFLKE